ncbi:MAG: hypothetical protein WCS42_10655 [Verrucomicrobiota bacterium]
MKINCARLTAVTTVAFLLSGFAADLLAYPTSYGPFPPGHEPAVMPLEKCKLVQTIKVESGKRKAGEFLNPDGIIREYRLPAAGSGKKQITLALRGTTNGCEINLSDAHGKNLLPGPFTNSMTTDQMEVFSGDLNGDGPPDFIINVWSGGCGLAADGSEVTFLLSGKGGYRASSFYLYGFGNQDLVRFKAGGPVYFIFNDLIGNGGEKTRDGRDHNFWVYDLYRIDGNRFVPADAEQPGFPKWVWFTNKANHEEATQLSPDQKNRLLMKRSFIK